MNIADSYRKLREEIPDDVTIVLAGKTITAKEIAEAINAGPTDIGQNYVQEDEAISKALGSTATGHSETATIGTWGRSSMESVFLLNTRCSTEDDGRSSGERS
ncbi:MAG: hypothetical protein JW818_21100 [Pirellulales bacterium]|nr:hypothetical protein [Pirellulales bacterium]